MCGTGKGNLSVTLSPSIVIVTVLEDEEVILFECMVSNRGTSWLHPCFLELAEK